MKFKSAGSCLLPWLLAVPLHAPATETGPVSSPSKSLAEHHDISLKLNGRGTRKAMFFELYTCELFLPDPTGNPAEILSENGPVSVRLAVHGDPPGGIPGEWAAVLKEELSDKLFRRTQRLYRDLQEGDRIELRYLPETGTRVTINGEALFTDPGNELIHAVLDQWIGETPVSADLKAALLGR